jgi:hypothetical protein
MVAGSTEGASRADINQLSPVRRITSKERLRHSTPRSATLSGSNLVAGANVCGNVPALPTCRAGQEIRFPDGGGGTLAASLFSLVAVGNITSANAYDGLNNIFVWLFLLRRYGEHRRDLAAMTTTLATDR